MLKPVNIDAVLSVKELYTLYYFHREKEYAFAGESHDFWEIIYADKGGACGINGTEPYTLHKGQVLFHKPNAFHNFHTSDEEDDCDIIVISFSGDLDILEHFSEQIFTLTLKEKHLFKQMVEEGVSAYNKPLGTNLIYDKANPKGTELTFGSKQIIRNLLEQLLISLYRKQQNCSSDILKLSMQSLSPEYELVKKVVTFLDENLYNNIAFIDVANHFNLSETQIKKMFRDVTGYSIMQYYRKSVIGRIEYHIRQFDLNFTEIADLFNFSSIHYFSKFYKRETGITPREYLKSS
ncbi:MAG: AraC family transcriptional regulator, partial [Oscillospiraceae bacterium]